MTNHLIFLFYLIIFLFSTIGYGYFFSNIFFKNQDKLNFGYLGILGFFVIIFFATISSFFLPHGFTHNTILHLFGLFYFAKNFFEDKKNNIYELKKLLAVFIIFLIGIYIFKNHDDFPYYHLTYALNLSENKFIIGTGVFSHGFRTSSSIFQYHSTLYLPAIKYYLFHSGPFFILVFFNYIILNKIYEKYKKNQFDIVYFFSILNFSFVNVVFYRIAEHGTDRSGQILLFLIFIVFFEIYFLKKNAKEKNILFNFLLVATFLAASMKVLFIIYLILVPIILYKDSFYKKYFVKNNFKIISVLFLSFSLNLTTNFFSTGCLVYPEEKTCFFEKFDWSLPEKEVKRLKIHYEWWAKSGGGAGYRSEIKPEEYVKNFVWINDWIDRHFFNKVSDTLLGIIFIALLNLFFFKNTIKTKFIPRKVFLINSILFLFILEWFLKHPSMRYGGYVLLALPLFIATSKKIESFKVNKKRIFVSTILIISLTLVVYNVRNISRLNKEITKYNPRYEISKSPFFHVESVQTKIIYDDNLFKVYSPINNMCWAAPTPCSYQTNIKVKNWNGFKIITRREE